MYQLVGRYPGNPRELVELIKPLAPTPTLPLLYNTTDSARTTAIFRPVLQHVFPGEWSKCFLSILWPPNGSIMPHADQDTAGQLRCHLVLQTNSDCWAMNGGVWVQLEEGGIYTMEQTITHASINWGVEPRVHLVVDRHPSAAGASEI